MSYIYNDLPVHRFIKTASSGLKSNTQYLSLMAANEAILNSSSINWTETADIYSSLTINDPTKSPDTSIYDAYIQSGNAETKSGTQIAYAGTVLYRLTLPSNSIPTDVTFNLSCDRYNIYGVNIAAYLSDVQHESTNLEMLTAGGYYYDGVEHTLSEFGTFDEEHGYWNTDSSKFSGFWNGLGWNTNDWQKVSAPGRNKDIGYFAAGTSLRSDKSGFCSLPIDITKLVSTATTDDLKFNYLYICLRLFNYQQYNESREFFIEGSSAIDSGSFEVTFETAYPKTYGETVISSVIPRSELIDEVSYDTYTDEIKIKLNTSPNNSLVKGISTGALTKYSGTYSKSIHINNFEGESAPGGLYMPGSDYSIGSDHSIRYYCTKYFTVTKSLIGKYLNFAVRLNVLFSQSYSQFRSPAYRVVALSLPSPDYEFDFSDPSIYDGSNQLCLGYLDVSESDLDFSSSAYAGSGYIDSNLKLRFKKNNSYYYFALLVFPTSSGTNRSLSMLALNDTAEISIS